jgi:hypothetical protein
LADGALWCEGRTLTPDQTFIKYRCFLWHVNEDTQPLYAGLTLQNVSANTIVASNATGVMFTNEGSGPLPPSGFPSPFKWFAAIRDGGRCIAQSMLARTLDGVPSMFKMVAPGTTGDLLHWGPLSPHKTYGVYVEFQVSGQANNNWVLREVFATSVAALVTRTACQTPLPITGGGGDGRGNWPTNMISIQAPVLEINGPPIWHRLHCAASYEAMPDNCWPPSGEAKGNKGKYGVVYADLGSYPRITLPFRIQPNTRAGTVQAWLTGGALADGHYYDFFGSASSMNAGGRPLPRINVNRSEAVMLYSRDYPFTPGPDPVNDAAIVSVAVAGDATTPFDIVLRWV